ncbi:MAG: iron-sulfur cluster biosynthesis family protein [Desulfuromonadaceae bacterium]|nr:iron-sulfur cluster biosynthesis family protein [Desulfuromonadaceae bacterium]
MIILSPEAKNRLEEMQKNSPGKFPRIHFQEKGIGMPDLKLTWTEKEEVDLPVETDGIPFFVAEDVSYFTSNLVISLDPQKKDFLIIPRGDDVCDGNCAACSGCPEP